MNARNLSLSPSSFPPLAFWGLVHIFERLLCASGLNSFASHVNQQKFLIFHISHTQFRCVHTKKYPFPRQKQTKKNIYIHTHTITPVLTCSCPQPLGYFNHLDRYFTSVVSVAPCLPHHQRAQSSSGQAKRKDR